MANNETINKVKALLEGHCYGPLREAAEKWLAVADEKYGDKFDELKEKAGSAYEKLGDLADKYSDASIKFTEKMAGVSEKVGDAYDKAAEKAAPALDKLGDKLEDKFDDAKEKIAPALDKFGDKLEDKFDDAKEKILRTELIKQLKEGVCSVEDLSETFEADDAVAKFGEEFTAKMRAHIAELKEKGDKFCDCDACKKARSILKDFGEDFGLKEDDDKED